MSDQTTRQQIVAAAHQLFYRRGYEHTSFAMIADAVQISRGNFYHHFKTKDEILDAVIESRLASGRQMLEKWEAESPAPADRIRSYIQLTFVNRADFKRYGCPVGTLSIELAKLGHASRREANELFKLIRGWLRLQFELLGRGDDADALALHVLARCQGVAVLASAFQDEKFIQREVEQMCAWVESCATGADGRPGDDRRTAATKRKPSRSGR